jgi:hypothetical protein
MKTPDQNVKRIPRGGGSPALRIIQKEDRFLSDTLAKGLLITGPVDGYYQLFVLNGPDPVDIVPKEVEKEHQDQQYNRYAYKFAKRTFHGIVARVFSSW